MVFAVGHSANCGASGFVVYQLFSLIHLVFMVFQRPAPVAEWICGGPFLRCWTACGALTVSEHGLRGWAEHAIP